jgi:drug/metabolite transporter (DMT)-like permease
MNHEHPTADRRIAYLLLTIMALCFAGTWVAGKVAVRTMPPMALAAGRFTVASICLWIWVRSRGVVRTGLTRRDLPIILAMGLTGVAGYNVVFLFGLKHAPASDGAIIVPGIAPALTAILSTLVLKERMHARGLLGFFIALVGMVFVMRPGGPVDHFRLTGDFLFLLGAVCWAVYSIIGKSATQRFGPIDATLYGTIAGTLMLYPLAVLENPWTAMAAAPRGAWFGLLYLGTFGTVVAFVCFYEGIRRLGAARASSFILLVPIFGVALAVSMLGERLATSTIAGGVLVLVGLWLVQRQGRPRASAPAGASASSPPRGA